jgi:hypothetical protein
MLEVMEQGEFLRNIQKVEEKLAQGLALTKPELTLLLMGMLLNKETRKERRYGQT